MTYTEAVAVQQQQQEYVHYPSEEIHTYSFNLV